MSWKSELAEVVDWLGDLTAEDSVEPSTVPLPRECWGLVRDALKRAADKFDGAATLATTSSVEADLAFDLGNETRVLADRAYVLERRARPKAAKSVDELTYELALKTAATKRLSTQVTKLRARVAELESQAPADRVVPPAPPAKPTDVQQPPTTALDRVIEGQRSLATAHDNLFKVTPPEQSVVDFAAELDVLNDLVEGWLRLVRRAR
jgi:hypothetical protein